MERGRDGERDGEGGKSRGMGGEGWGEDGGR